MWVRLILTWSDSPINHRDQWYHPSLHPYFKPFMLIRSLWRVKMAVLPHSMFWYYGCHSCLLSVCAPLSSAPAEFRSRPVPASRHSFLSPNRTGAQNRFLTCEIIFSICICTETLARRWLFISFRSHPPPSSPPAKFGRQLDRTWQSTRTLDQSNELGRRQAYGEQCHSQSRFPPRNNHHAYPLFWMCTVIRSDHVICLCMDHDHGHDGVEWHVVNWGTGHECRISRWSDGI